MRGSPRPPCCMRLALSAGPHSSAFMHMLWQFSWLLTSSAIILSLSWKTLSMAQGGETCTGSSQDTPRDDCEDSPRCSDLIACLLPTIRSLVQEGIQLSLSLLPGPSQGPSTDPTVPMSNEFTAWSLYCYIRKVSVINYLSESIVVVLESIVIHYAIYQLMSKLGQARRQGIARSVATGRAGGHGVIQQ